MTNKHFGLISRDHASFKELYSLFCDGECIDMCTTNYQCTHLSVAVGEVKGFISTVCVNDYDRRYDNDDETMVDRDALLDVIAKYL